MRMPQPPLQTLTTLEPNAAVCLMNIRRQTKAHAAWLAGLRALTITFGPYPPYLLRHAELLCAS